MEFITTTCAYIASFPMTQSLLAFFGFTGGTVSAQIICLALLLLVIAANLAFLIALLVDEFFELDIFSSPRQKTADTSPSVNALHEKITEKTKARWAFMNSLDERQLQEYLDSTLKKLKQHQEGTLDEPDFDRGDALLNAQTALYNSARFWKPPTPEQLAQRKKEYQLEQIKEWLAAHPVPTLCIEPMPQETIPIKPTSPSQATRGHKAKKPGV